MNTPHHQPQASGEKTSNSFPMSHGLPPTVDSKETLPSESYRQHTAVSMPRRRSSGRRRALHSLALILVPLVAGFFGAWAFAATPLGDSFGSPAIIEENRSTIVLQEGEVVAEVAQKVSPSVVSIVTESRNGSSRFTSSAAGTGIIISEDGYILTNKHVIPEGTRNVEVVLSDGRSFDDVDVVGRDPLNDIAFLKINDVNGLKPATIADSNEVKIGTTVIAIGNALGQFQTSVTSGIISGTGRSLVASDGSGDTESLEDLFQTDAAINSGNSGGPLVNLEGEVIGINTAVANQAQGIGFAIPINAAKGLIKSVLEDGRVARAYIGIRYQSLTPELAQELDTPVTLGAYVDGSGDPAIVPDSPASRTDLREGDIITAVNGTKITASAGLGILLAQYMPGDTITLTVLNESGDERQVRITLEELRQ